MPEKSLEEQANDLLRDAAHEAGVSLRRLGIIDRRREQTINRREVSMSEMASATAVIRFGRRRGKQR